MSPITEVQNQLAEVKAQGKAAPREQIDKVKVDAYKLPPCPEAESPDQRAKRLKVRQAIDDLDVEIIKDTVLAKERTEFNELRAKHDSLLMDGDFAKAAELLTDTGNASRFSDKSLLSEFAELKEAFPKKATVRLKALVDGDLEAHKFKDANAAFMRFHSNPSITKLFRGNGGLEEECKALKPTIDRRQDRFYYDSACRARTKQSAQDYLDLAPMKTMEKEMKGLVEFKKNELGEVSVANLKLAVRKIYWRSYFNANKDNRLRIWCNDAPIYDDFVSSKAADTTTPEISIDLPKLKLNELTKIEVWITRSSNFVGAYGADCTGSEKRTAFDWNGKLLQVNGGPREVDVTIGIEALPIEPELPAWRSK